MTVDVTTLDERAFERAIKKAGSQAKLARAIRVTPNVVNMWRYRGRIPPEKAVEVERVTGVNRRELQKHFPWD